MATSAQTPEYSKLLAYLQLFRLPNVFTAMSDVLMGFVVTHGSLQPWQPLVLLLAASSLIYTAGMVLNDVYDVEIDARERPGRPVPSGRVSLVWARWLGYEMLLVGIACAAMVSYLSADFRPVAVAAALALMVVLYDRVLKHTLAGPLAMGACRFFNVLLGMSASPDPWEAVHWLIAAGIGLYILGVTLFAKNEASTSSRLPLTLAAAVILAALGLLAWYPQWMEPDRLTVLVRTDPGRWQLLWIMLGILIGFRLVRAIAAPTPQNVQTAIKQSILSLIILDAVVAYGASGIAEATVILCLLLPAMFLGRRVYST